MKWTSIKFLLPPQNVFVYTKICDQHGERNHSRLQLKGNLWFLEDGTYVYYTPTHWSY